MTLNRRSLIGGLFGSAILTGLPASLSAMGRQRAEAPAPRFRGARNVGPPHADAVLAMHMILDAVGMRRSIDLFAADVRKENIAGFATVINGRRYIVYDREYVTWPDDVTPLSSVFVIAHEIGHHLGTHLHRKDASRHHEELEADRFAGMALSRLGFSEEQATSYYHSDRPATDTHPSAPDCREAVREGWWLGERVKRQELRRSMQRQRR